MLTPQVLMLLVLSLCFEGVNPEGSAFFTPPPLKAPQYACQLFEPIERALINVAMNSQTASSIASVQLLEQYHSHGL